MNDPRLETFGHLAPTRAAWPERRQAIAEAFPAVDVDPHHLITDNRMFGELVRDVIRFALPRTQQYGHRPTPTPEQFYDGWQYLVDNARRRPR